MTYKANSIVNVPVIPAENLTLFGETIYPIMNVNVSAVTTTIEGLPIVTVASGSNGQVLGTATLSVASTTGFSSPTGSLYCQDSPAGFASINYQNTDATDFLQQVGRGGLLVAGYGVTTQSNYGTINSSSGGQTLPQGTINIDVPFVTPPPSGTMYIWTQSSSSGQVVSYSSYTGSSPTVFSGCSGGTTQLTTGDLVFFTPYTTVTSPSAGTNLGTYILYVNSTTGIPTPSGTSYIYSGGQIDYTGITGGGTPSFTGCYNGSGTVHTGDAITLGLPYTPLPVASTAGFPTSGTIFGNIAYTGTTSTSFTGITGGTGVTISNGQSVSLNTSCSWLGFPKGIPFTMGLRNTLISAICPFLASASGNAASLISAETTIASGSNGQTLPQSVIFVASTQYYPSSGTISINDTDGYETIQYTSITGGGTPSFNGCSGGTGTLSTGDTVLPTGYNAALTGLNNVTGIEQNNVAVGNAGSPGNSIGLNGIGATFINSTSVGVNVGGTLPDPNNGSILWALTDYVYDVSVNVVSDGLPDSGNSIHYFVCDGYNVRLAQSFKQNYWSNENFTMNDGFNFENINGQNLLYFTLSVGSLTAPFSFALPYNDAFVTTITNTTSFDCTFGLTSGETSFDTGGTTVIIAPGQAVIVGADGTNVFFSNQTTLKPVRVNNGNSPYQIIEPPGVTYLVDTSGGAVTIYTPFNPVDGQTFTIKDSTGDWATHNLTITQIGTTIAAGSNTATLPQSTIFVASTTGFPTTGTITINDTDGYETIQYTSITGGGTPSFNGCSGGTGTLATSNVVSYGIDSIENIYSYTANIPPYSTSNPMFTGSGTYIGIPAKLVLSVKGNSVTLTYGLTENTWFITEQLLAD